MEKMKITDSLKKYTMIIALVLVVAFFYWSTEGAGGYAPYAILNWLNPLTSIFYGFTGISMEKMIEEEYQKVLEEREAEKLAALKALEA